MASFCIRQTNEELSLGKGTSPYVIASDERNFPHVVSQYLNSTFLTPEVQATYAALRQAEIDAVRVRQAWVKSLADSLQPQVANFLDNFPNTHPEAYL